MAPVMKRFTPTFLSIFFLWSYTAHAGDVFEEIFSCFNDTNTKLEFLCDLLDGGLVQQTIDLIDNGFESTWTILACSSEIKPISEPNTTISEPGSYCLTQDISSSSGDAINIVVSNVTLDLRGHTISAPNGGDDGIQLANADNVLIFNGFITNCGGRGINTFGSTDSAIYRNIHVSNCGTDGIRQVGTNGIMEHCSCTNCGFSTASATGGFRLQGSNHKLISCSSSHNNSRDYFFNSASNCVMKFCTSAQTDIGVDVNNSDFICLIQCSAFDNAGESFCIANSDCTLLSECFSKGLTPSAVGRGILVSGANQALIYKCQVGNIIGGTTTHGINLTGSTDKSLVINSLVHNVRDGSSSTGIEDDSSGSNLIIGNLAFCNDTNYTGVAPIYDDGINGEPTRIDNLSFPSTGAGLTLFEQTWTAIQEVTEIACDKFEQTQTMITSVDVQASFDATWTTLNELNESLCSKFEQTWTVIEDIQSTVFNQFCQPIFLTSADFSPNLCIDSSGNYVFAENIDYSGTTTAIIIDSNDVVLNLNNRKLSQDSALPLLTGILIEDAHNDIKIKNGIISGFTHSGIRGENDLNRIRVNDISVVDAGGQGIIFEGSSGDNENIAIKDCKVIECLTSFTGYAIHLDECINSRVQDCSILECGPTSGRNEVGVGFTSCDNCCAERVDVKGLTGDAVTAFEIESSNNCFLRDCNAVRCIGDQESIIFNVDDSDNTILKHCLTLHCESTNTSLSSFKCSESDNCFFEKCTEIFSVAESINRAFDIQNCNYFMGVDCIANHTRSNANNAYGFVFGDPTTPTDNPVDCSTLQRCYARYVHSQGTGFAGLGIVLNNANECSIVECHTSRNFGSPNTSARGFVQAVTNTSSNSWIRNVAIQNGRGSSTLATNYSNIPAAWIDDATFTAPDTICVGGGAPTRQEPDFTITNLSVRN